MGFSVIHRYIIFRRKIINFEYFHRRRWNGQLISVHVGVKEGRRAPPRRQYVSAPLTGNEEQLKFCSRHGSQPYRRTAAAKRFISARRDAAGGITR